MQLQVMAVSGYMVEELRNREIFEQVTQITMKEEISGEYVLISDSYVPYEELRDLDFKNQKKVFYTIENEHEINIEKTVQAICASLDIIYIPALLDTSQKVDSIEEKVNPLKQSVSNVITFFSSVSNVGTTTTCLSTAKAIQENTNAKVGVLLINAWDSGDVQLEYTGSYLNEIKNLLSADLLTSEQELLSHFHMEKKDALYILGGNKNTRLERMYTVDEIHFLIEQSKKLFDVVLIDAGSHFDNVIIVQSLKESDLRFLVLNQQRKAVNKLNQYYEDVLYPLGYVKSDFLLILNQYKEETYLPSARNIQKEIDVPLISIVDDTENGLLSEVESRVLYDYSDQVYKETIHAIVRTIGAHTGIETNFEHKAKTPIFKKIFRKG